MSIAATERPAQSNSSSLARNRASRLRSLWDGFEQTGDWLDNRPRLLLLILGLVYLAFVLPNSYARLMWHDELFTYNLALSPSLSRMFHNIRLIDLNPPLLYLFDYVILRLPGVHANDHLASMAARLPSISAGLIGSLGLFAWLWPRLGPLWSLLGVSVLWNTEFLVYAGEDRPYELMVAFAILLILARERAVEPQRDPAWVGATLLLGAAMVGSHFMGAFVLLAFLAAEAVRAWGRRCLDLPLTLSYLLPFGIIAAYRGTVSGYGTILFPSVFRPHLITAPMAYIAVARYVSLLLLAGLLLLLIPGGSTSPTPLRRMRSLAALTAPDYALLIGLFLEPLIAVSMVARSHGAYFPRYGLPASIPIAILTALLFCALFHRSRGVAILAILLLWGYPARLCARALGFPSAVQAEAAEKSSLDLHTIDPSLPLVAASGLTFVEMNHRESPAFLQRTWFLTDREAAIRYAHATLFEGEAEVARVFRFQAHVEPLPSFEAEHPKFLVLGTWNYQEEWLLRKLHADGDLVRYLGRCSAGYGDHQLYEITIKKKAQ